MTDENLFGTDDNKDQSQNDPLNTKIEELKTKPVDELAKGKAHADMFIEHLKDELKGLKEELDKRANAEKLLEELKNTRQERSESEATKVAGVEPDDVKSLVQELLSQEAEKKLAIGNLTIVQDAIKEKYGDKSVEFIANKAKELNVSPKELEAMAAKSPKMFFNAIGFQNQTVNTNITKGSVNSEILDNQTTKSGTYKYYQELRKANPTQFYSPKVQKQMFEDRKSKGEDFYK
jgi:hypothetical protein